MSTTLGPWRRRLLLCAIACTALFSQAHAYAQARFEGEGRVVAVTMSRGTVTLDHGPILDFLPAQRTEFPVERASLLSKVRISDLVRFALAAPEDRHGLLAVTDLQPLREEASDTERAGMSVGGVSQRGLLVLWAALVVATGTGLYAIWHTLREVRRALGSSTRVQQELGESLRLIASTGEEIARTLRDRYPLDLRRRIAVARGWNGSQSDGAPGELVVVRRGEAGLFQRLQAQAEARHAQVVWDRRSGDRRAARRAVPAERRRRERRAPLADPWVTLGFVILPLPSGARAAGRKA